MNTYRQRTAKYLVGVITLSCFGSLSLFAATNTWDFEAIQCGELDLVLNLRPHGLSKR
jgi:hypothetical protein